MRRFAAVLLLGCGSEAVPLPAVDSAAEGATDSQSEAASDGAADGDGCAAPTPVPIDCTGGAAPCKDVVIAGDPPEDNPTYFRGYGDPAVREDPVTHTLRLAYSHLGNRGAGTYVVATHLAHSDDKGASWTYDGAPFPIVPSADPTGGKTPGFMSSEAPEILPVEAGGSVTWYWARLSYFIPDGAGYHPRLATTMTMHVGASSSLADAGTTKEAVLGARYTDAAIGALPLGTVSDAVADCGLFNNPALWFEGGKLYLVAECVVANLATGGADDSKGRIEVFRTTPTGAPPSWTWSYVGALTSPAIAAELGDATLNQASFARAADGKLLLLVTPSHTSGDKVVHTACDVLEVESLDPPRLARDCGKLRVRATLFAKDIPSGTTSASYDAASVGGVLFGRRPKADTDRFGFFQTGLRP